MSAVLDLPGLELPGAGRANLAEVAAATATSPVAAPKPPGAAATPSDQGSPASGAPEPKNRGGRPRGVKDSKPRKRPARRAAAGAPPAPRVTPEEFSAALPSSPASAPPAPLDPERVAELARSIGATAGVLFSALGAMFGDHWQLTPDQSAALGEVWAPIAARHVGPESSAAAPYLAAAVVTAGILVPRVRETRRARATARKVADAEPAPAVVHTSSAAPTGAGPVFDSALGGL